MKKVILCSLCTVLILCGCTFAQGNQPAPSAMEEGATVNPPGAVQDAIPTETNSADTKQWGQEVDFTSYFQGIDGCAIIYDSAKAEYLVYNPQIAEKRSSPCSTFKIVSTLIGLQASVLTSEDTAMKWNGTPYPVREWNGDLTLKQAFQSSCIWYFREVIDRAGPDAVRQTLSQLSYGNQDISQWEGSNTNAGYPELNGFWLESSLLISPKEQLDVLMQIFETKDYADLVPTLKSIMFTEAGEGETNFYGKTGMGFQDNVCVDAWFIGFAEKADKTYYFAVRLDDRQHDSVSGQKAKEIAFNIMKNYLK